MINNSLLEQWETEDIPYFDLTTHAFGIGHMEGEMNFYSREEGVLSGAEEVEGLCEKNGLQPEVKATTGDWLIPKQPFFTVKGSFASLYKISKVSQNIFEYASGIATRTHRLVQLAREVNDDISVLATRKTFPGTKQLAIKSILAGGGLPHRLGLSETILLFKHHINFCDSKDELRTRLEKMKKHHCEKKILIEADTVEEAEFYSELAIDGIQYDKFSTVHLREIVNQLRQSKPGLIHLATGGVNEKNIKEYATTGVNGIVTTSVYFGKPLDIGVTITPI